MFNKWLFLVVLNLLFCKGFSQSDDLIYAELFKDDLCILNVETIKFKIALDKWDIEDDLYRIYNSSYNKKDSVEIVRLISKFNQSKIRLLNSSQFENCLIVQINQKLNKKKIVQFFNQKLTQKKKQFIRNYNRHNGWTNYPFSISSIIYLENKSLAIVQKKSGNQGYKTYLIWLKNNQIDKIQTLEKWAY